MFGLRKSAETRKALRFFSERRIRAHFVDLAERPLAAGELLRFVQRFGVAALIDRESRRLQELGLRHSNMSDARWIEKLAEEPLLLRLPLVRRLGQPPAFTIALDEDTWKGWLG